MQDLFIEFLPPWVETNLQPAFYDAESGTVLQQTARMYAKINELVKSVNGMEKVLKEAIDYIDNYFKNLDVQEEIDNKLDDMAESGELTEIISAYLEMRSVLAYNSVSEMVNATNLISGSFAETYGYYQNGDGGSAKYKIRTATEEDEPDNATLFAIEGVTDYDLVAELVPKTPFNVKCVGVKGDGTTDDTDRLQIAIDKCIDEDLACYVPEGTYMVSNITIDGTMHFYGDGFKTKFKSIANNSESSIISVVNAGVNFCNIHDFSIDGNRSNNAGVIDGLKVDITESQYGGDLYGHVYNIRVLAPTGNGVVFQCSAPSGSMKEMRIENISSIGASKSGFKFSVVNDSLISNCTTAGTIEYGFYFYNTSTLKFTGCKAFWCGIGDGVTIEDANRLPNSAFTVTSDASPVAGRTYYTRSGSDTENDYYEFTLFTGDSFDGGTTYYTLGTTYTKRYAGFKLDSVAELMFENCESQDNFGDGFNVSGGENKFVNVTCDNNGLITVDGNPVSYASQNKEPIYYGIYGGGWQLSAVNCNFMNHLNSSIGKSQKGPAYIKSGGYITINGNQSNQAVTQIQIQHMSDPLIIASKINNRDWVYDLPISSYITLSTGFELVDNAMNFVRCDNNTLKFQIAVKKANDSGMLDGTTAVYFANLANRIRPNTRQSITAYATDNYGYLVQGYVTGIVETDGFIGARYVDDSLDSAKQIVIQGEFRIK